MKNILYVEEPIEVKSSINYGLDLKDTIIIALTIRVQSFLKKNNINFNNTLQYFNNKAHANCLKYSNDLVESIEKEFLNNEIQFNATNDWLSNSIRLSATNYIIFLIEIIFNSLNSHRPEMVIIPQFGPSSFSGWSIKPNHYFHGELSKIIAKKNNIKTLEFEINAGFK